jgi:hypothetical protein
VPGLNEPMRPMSGASPAMRAYRDIEEASEIMAKELYQEACASLVGEVYAPYDPKEIEDLANELLRDALRAEDTYRSTPGRRARSHAPGCF